MLMTIAAAFISTSSRDSMSDWLPPSKQNIRLIVAVMGALLDMVTLAFVMREQRKSTRLMAIFHLFLLLPAMIHEYVPLAIIRMLVATFLARFLACLVELDWVVSGQPLSNKPSPAWLQGGCVLCNTVPWWETLRWMSCAFVCPALSAREPCGRRVSHLMSVLQVVGYALSWPTTGLYECYGQNGQSACCTNGVGSSRG